MWKRASRRTGWRLGRPLPRRSRRADARLGSADHAVDPSAAPACATHWSTRSLGRSWGQHTIVRGPGSGPACNRIRLEEVHAIDRSEFEGRGRDVIGLSSIPRSMPPSLVDEKTAIQALVGSIRPALSPAAPNATGSRLPARTCPCTRAQTRPGESSAKRRPAYQCGGLSFYRPSWIRTSSGARCTHRGQSLAHQNAAGPHILGRASARPSTYTPTFVVDHQVELWFSKIERDVNSREASSPPSRPRRKLMPI